MYYIRIYTFLSLHERRIFLGLHGAKKTEQYTDGEFPSYSEAVYEYITWITIAPLFADIQ